MDAVTVSRTRVALRAIEQVTDMLVAAIDAAQVFVPPEIESWKRAADPRAWLADAVSLHRGQTAPHARRALDAADRYLEARIEAESMLREAWAGHETGARGQIREELVESSLVLRGALHSMLAIEPASSRGRAGVAMLEEATTREIPA